MDMKQLNRSFAGDGERKLPPGFRFLPTDKEIVFQYLARKILSLPLPASIIPEVAVFSFDPADLPAAEGESDSDRYFFIRKSDYNRDGDVVPACPGYWKAIAPDKRITASSKKLPLMGIKKSFEFRKKNRNGSCGRTGWTLHEHCIAVTAGNNTGCSIPHEKKSRRQNASTSTPIGNWVVCHLFMKKRRGKANTISEKDTSSSSSSSSSSYSSDSSSTLTEVSS